MRFAGRQDGSDDDRNGVLELVVRGGEIVVAAVVVDVVILVEGAHVPRVTEVRARPEFAPLRARRRGRVGDVHRRRQHRRRRREDGGEEDREDEDEMAHRP